MMQVRSLVPESVLRNRLAYNGDIVAGQLAVFRGASKAPISELIRAERATWKNSQLAAAQTMVVRFERNDVVLYVRRYASSR
ncbi:MAG: hypothetical protein JO334_18945 [Verrucomicrobia bacterium]|nr:hypothetical protein [Verrucomicrobiota bacterium]